MNSLILWRAEIGNFYNCSHKLVNKRKKVFSVFCRSRNLPVLLLYFQIILECLNLNFAPVIDLLSNPVSASLFSFFNCCIKSYMHHKCIYTKFLYMYFVTNALPYTFLILLCSGDIEINPGPEPSYWENLSVCHWNLNSLSAHNFIKKESIVAFNSIHNFDFICLSETFLDSDLSLDNQDLLIEKYTLFRADHPSNSKKEVFVFIIKAVYQS